MTAATATAQPNAREAYLASQAIMGTTGIDVHSPRFFVQMGWARLNVDSFGAPNCALLRGEITPCSSFQQKSNLLEIPEGALIQGSEKADRDGRTVYGYYWKPAWFEAERLLDIEASAERKDGLVEIKTLSANPRLYREVDFTAVFFPSGLGNLPQTNKEMIAHLTERIGVIELNGDPRVPPYAKGEAIAIGQELLAAAELVQRLQLQRLDYTHSCMKMPPSEEQYKRGYDVVDEEMIVRTGIPRIHDADLKVATAIHTLADAQTAQNVSDPALLALVAAQQEQNALLKQQMEQQNALIQQLLAERNGDGANGRTGDGEKKPRPKSLVKSEYYEKREAE